MTTTQKVAITVSTMLLVSALLYAWASRDHYEYHQGMDGTIMWRCNKSSGVVEFCTPRAGWQLVKEGNPFEH